MEDILEKATLEGACQKEKKPDIKVNITINGEERATLDLETLFLVGIHKGGMKEDHAEMASVVCGDFGMMHYPHIAKIASRELKKTNPFDNFFGSGSGENNGLSEVLTKMGEGGKRP